MVETAQALGSCSAALTPSTAFCVSPSYRPTNRSTCSRVSQNRLVPTSTSISWADAGTAKNNDTISGARRGEKLMAASLASAYEPSRRPARQGAPASPRRRCYRPVRFGEVRSAAPPSEQILRSLYGARPDESLARIAAFGLTLPQYRGQPQREGRAGRRGGALPRFRQKAPNRQWRQRHALEADRIVVGSPSSAPPRLLLRSTTRDRPPYRPGLHIVPLRKRP